MLTCVGPRGSNSSHVSEGVLVLGVVLRSSWPSMQVVVVVRARSSDVIARWSTSSQVKSRGTPHQQEGGAESSQLGVVHQGLPASG